MACRWTPDELDTLREMWGQKIDEEVIAKKLGRSIGGLVNKAKEIGLPLRKDLRARRKKSAVNYATLPPHKNMHIAVLPNQGYCREIVSDLMCCGAKCMTSHEGKVIQYCEEHALKNFTPKSFRRIKSGAEYNDYVSDAVWKRLRGE